MSVLFDFYPVEYSEYSSFSSVYHSTVHIQPAHQKNYSVLLRFPVGCSGLYSTRNETAPKMLQSGESFSRGQMDYHREIAIYKDSSTEPLSSLKYQFFPNNPHSL